MKKAESQSTSLQEGVSIEEKVEQKREDAECAQGWCNVSKSSGSFAPERRRPIKERQKPSQAAKETDEAAAAVAAESHRRHRQADYAPGVDALDVVGAMWFSMVMRSLQSSEMPCSCFQSSPWFRHTTPYGQLVKQGRGRGGEGLFVGGLVMVDLARK